MTHTVGYAATGPHSKLKPYEFERTIPKANEVEIEILNCGICHSDVHQARNEWHNTVFPCMPGHEIVGKVVASGAAVKKFAVGDRVGVGCLIDSCHECSACREGPEQLCERGCLVPTDISKMIMERKTLATSLIGGIRETQEVLDFCAKHSIKPNIKVVPIDFVNSAFDDLAEGRVDFRYVIDMSSMHQKHQTEGILERLFW